MTAPQNLPMTEKYFLLRVFSVKRLDDNRPEPAESRWEVRADAVAGDRNQASLFYTEIDPCNLPHADSLLRVAIGDRITGER